MVFSSPIFLLLFLPFTLLFYYLTADKYRNLLLLLISMFFYIWGETTYVYLILASIFFNFIFGQWIVSSKPFLSKIILCVGILVNIGVLIYFKYIGFIATNLSLLTKHAHVVLSDSYSILPVGISFFTFQNISYIVDVYYKRTKPESNPLDYGLFISFFPHLVAGPIVRYADLVEDIKSRVLLAPWVVSGIKRFIIGLAKKVLIANSMAYVADSIMNLPYKELNASVAWLGIIAYSLQLYFDFSGYSDMAIGLSRMFGFNFLENFNYPYMATSVTDFWRRWHMSLSHWFRDYVYIPLGGNRKGKFRMYVNLIIVFFLTGLWHGASWNFIIWGMIHGFFITVERIGGNKVLERLGKPMAHLYLLMVVIISWVFFRLESFEEAKGYLFTMFGGGPQKEIYTTAFYCTNEVLIMMIAGILFSTPVVSFLMERGNLSKYTNAYAIWIVYMLLLMLSVAGLANGTYNPFIYSRF